MVRDELGYLWFLSALPILGLFVRIWGLSPLPLLFCFLPLAPVFLSMWACHAIWQKLPSWPLRGLIFFLLFAAGIIAPFFVFFVMLGGASMAVADGGVTGRQLASQALGVSLELGAGSAAVWTVIVVWLMKALAEAKASRRPKIMIACLSAGIFGVALVYHQRDVSTMAAFHPDTVRILSDEDLVKYAGTLPKIKASEFAFVLGMHKGKPVIVTSLCFESNCPEHPNRILNYNYSPERCGSVGGVVKKFKLTIYNHKRVEQFCIPGPVAEKF